MLIRTLKGQSKGNVPQSGRDIGCPVVLRPTQIFDQGMRFTAP
jgi:hypothetical protein